MVGMQATAIRILELIRVIVVGVIVVIAILVGC